MKYGKKLAKRDGRIKYWESYGGTNKESGHIHTKPGSQTK